MRLDGRRLRAVYRRLLTAYGPQHWWPGDTPFEVMIGAVLTQNTAWVNVERAIANLRAADALSPQAIAAAPHGRLAAWLKPSGYFNLKAGRLQAFCRWYLEVGGYDALAAWETAALRHALLAVHGIGPETADDMLLYAFERPVFVVDAYTRRLLTRLGMLEGEVGYERLRGALESALGADVALFNEFHALVVEHAKRHCRRRPRCAECPLMAGCHAAAPV